MVRLVLMDAQDLVVEGLRSLIASDPDLQVVGSAQTLSSGLTLIREHDPHAVILTLRLADAKGTEIVASARRESQRARILVLARISKLPSILRERCVAAGADAFIEREGPKEAVVPTIRQKLGVGPPAPTAAGCLSAREREVADLAAVGKSNPEIANLLGVSTNTVKTHLSRVMAKLGINKRVTLALDWKQRANPPTRD